MSRSPTPLTSLTPHEVAERLKQGRIVLVDVREADEFARRRIPGAVSRPLSVVQTAPSASPSGDVVFTCRTGMRTGANAERLQRTYQATAFVLNGGIDAWAAAGLPVRENRKAPLELTRQVQIAAGLLVLLGVVLGFALSPAFFGISAFVGAGLAFAGVSGFCGMARLMALAPWNRQVAA